MALLAVPNVSEGRDQVAIDAMGVALKSSGATLLDVHRDGTHHRSVFTLTGDAPQLVDGVLNGVVAAFRHINISTHEGAHPHIGALDVAPFVFTRTSDRGSAVAAALCLADRIATELEIPVFLYGMLSSHGFTRAELRRGGPAGLAARLAAGELAPDFGPDRLHPRAGATLVAARPPLVAFNVELAAPAGLEAARRIAAEIREGGPAGLPGLRAIGIRLADGVAQVSTNIEAPDRVRAADVIAAVAVRAPVAAAELVGLAPARCLDGFPAEVPLRNRRTLEEALPCDVE